MKIRPPRAFAALFFAALVWAAHAAAQTPDPAPPSTEPQAGSPMAPAAPAAAAPAAAPAIAVVPRSGEVLLNFQAADLQAVVKAVSQMTGRNVLIDPRVRGQVTIVSARPMPVEGAYQVFLSALKAQGFTAVEGPGDAVRIVPVAEAKSSAPVNDQESPPRGGEQIVTQVVIGQNVAVSQLQNVLRPLMSPTSQLSIYDPANALVITDYADNVRRLLRIIDRIDKPAGTDVTVIPLDNASALDVAELVVRLSGTVTGPGGVPGAPPTQIAAGGDRFSVVPDTRTNSLLLRSDNPGRIAQLRSLIAKLDVPARVIGSTRVIYLKNAEAPKLVEVLRGMLSAAAAAAPAGVAGAARPGGGGGATSSLIQADEATNSIIINASDTVYNNLRAVIEQLDVRRAQVYVEALVAEMNADRVDELGIQWAAAGQVGSQVVGAAANFPGAAPSIATAIASPATAAAGASGLLVAVLGKKVTLADGTTVQGLGALARALTTNNLGNILSTPNLLTLDNYQAKIVIGQNVPFVTGAFATPAASGATGGAVNPFQTIERRDVGLTLRIKPQISEGSTIRMEIYQEVSDIATTVTAGASDLITNKRSLETKVIVDDGQTIVLGGLIQNTLNETMQAIPLLGEIPFIGALFRFKSMERKRTNLMIFLRPVIIRSADDGYRVTQDRYEYLRGYTRGEGPERENIYDRMEPVLPPPPKEPARGPNAGSPALAPKQPDAGVTLAPAAPVLLQRQPDAGATPAQASPVPPPRQPDAGAPAPASPALPPNPPNAGAAPEPARP
ncbi:MAG TPA: type II secretion system secretin GspD [Burkholderiales bacterium]